MPRSKFEGDIFLISSEVTNEMRELAVRWGITGVYLKGNNEEFDSLVGQQKGKNVALVDDQVATSSSLGRLFEAEGASVTVYNYPGDALRDIPDHIPPFAVVFTDFNMPIMNGMQLAQKLRAGEN